MSPETLSPDTLHFAEPQWLWGLLAIPAVMLLSLLFSRTRTAMGSLKALADPHLLPHLVQRREGQGRASIIWPLLLWSMMWACGTLAMAGPRWNFTDVTTGKPGNSLVILLDLSKSMDAQDVAPSRLIRAREEIDDILGLSRGLDIGLIGFAAIPDMIVPLTGDATTIRHLLPSLDTGIVAVQGSRIGPAIGMASDLLAAAPGHSKSMLIISDGGFSDNGIAAAHDAANKGIAVYTMGIGTSQGAPIPADGGGWIKDANGATVVAKLGSGPLRTIASMGGGSYLTAEYSDAATRAMLNRMEAGAALDTDKGRTVRIWDEKFYIPALAMAILLLPFFRRGGVFPCLILLTILLTQAGPARADWLDWFRNPAQQGQRDFVHGDYSGAANRFDTPYRKGVAQYKAGQYDQSAKSFGAVSDPRLGFAAQYDKGNAQLLANKPQDAIASYQSALKIDPKDKSAAHNLQVAQKLLQQQQKEQDKQSQNNQKQGKQGQDQQQNSGKSSDSKNSASNGQDQKSQDQNAQNQNAQNQNGQSQNSRNAQQKPEDGKSGQPQSGQAKPQPAPVQPPQKPQNQTGQGEEGQKSADNNQQQTAPQGQSTAPLNETGKPPEQASEAPPSNATSAENGKPETQASRRMPQDVDADQWLSRADSDPRPFLKNQFSIEARKSGAQPEDNPW